MEIAWSAQSRPAIASHLIVSSSPGAIRIDSDDREYFFDHPEFPGSIQLLELADGTMLVEELANTCALSVSAIDQILTALANDNLAVDAEGIIQSKSTRDLILSCRKECSFWNRQITGQPLWQEMTSGNLSTRIVLGWGIELYHFINSANEHMASAIAHFQGPDDLRRRLVKHYIEEHDHQEIFLDGLVACGIDRSRILDAPPLPGTRAVVDYLNELAITDTLGYSAVFGIMQASMSEKPPSAAEYFFSKMCELYPSAAGLFSAALRHTLIDVSANHGDLLFDALVRSQDLPNASQRLKVVESIRSVGELFMLSHDNILDFYSNSTSPFPRCPVRVSAMF